MKNKKKEKRKEFFATSSFDPDKHREGYRKRLRQLVKQHADDPEVKNLTYKELYKFFNKALAMDVIWGNRFQMRSQLPTRRRKNYHMDTYLEDPDQVNLRFYSNPEQYTYLLNKELQRKIFENLGWKYEENPDYGLVDKAVQRFKSHILTPDVPMYSKNKDDIYRESVIPIGNYYGKDPFDAVEYDPIRYYYDGYPVVDPAYLGVPNLSDEDWYGFDDSNKVLLHPGYHPTAIYVDPQTGKIYYKEYDFNNYSNLDSPDGKTSNHDYTNLEQFGARLLDRIGSPTVVTSNILQASAPIKLTSVKGTDDFENQRNFIKVNPTDGTLGYWAPNTVITPKPE